MRIGIIGLGGIGGFIGAPLAKYYGESKEHEIIFICRGKTLENIRLQGLKIRYAKDELIVKPQIASDNPDEIGVLDVLLITVKSFSLREVVQQYKSNITSSTIIITTQNLVNSAELVRQVIPEKGTVLEGCIYVASNVIEPGYVGHKGGPGKLFFGGAPMEDHTEVVSILQASGLDVTYEENIQKILWSKYLFVSPVAAVTAAHNVTFGKIIEDEMLKKQVLSLMNEVFQLAHKNDVVLDQDIIDDSFNMLYKFPYEAKSSLQLDYELGKKTEREFLVDFVYNRSKEAGLEADAYFSIMTLLREK